jgi:zinc transport system permease protein
MSTIMDAVRGLAKGGAEAGWLPSAFGFGFVVNALVCAVLLGPVLGGVGPLVVTKRLAFFAQAIGQAAITGVALGLLLGEPAERPYVSLFAFCALFALAMTFTRHRTAMAPDTLIAVFLSISLAAGACLLPVLANKADAHLIEAILFGSILTAGDADIAVLLVIAVLCVAVGMRYFNAIVLASFNPALAQVRGIRVIAVEYLFVLLVTGVTVAAVKIIGAVLVEALLIVPAAAARNLSTSLRGFVGWSVLLCTTSCVVGILAPMSLDLRVPSGAAIILVAALLFGASAIVRAARKDT